MLHPSLPHSASSISLYFILHFFPKSTEQLQKREKQTPLYPVPRFPDHYLLLHAFVSEREIGSISSSPCKITCRSHSPAGARFVLSPTRCSVRPLFRSMYRILCPLPRGWFPGGPCSAERNQQARKLKHDRSFCHSSPRPSPPKKRIYRARRIFELPPLLSR